MMHIRITGKQIVIGEALPHRVHGKVSAATFGIGFEGQESFDVALGDPESQLRRNTKRLKNHHDRGRQHRPSDPA